MIQVYFKKSPTGSPFFLAYSQGEHGFVSEQTALALEEAGVIDPINQDLNKGVPAGDFVPAKEMEGDTEKVLDLSTQEGAKERFGNDIDLMREYCKKEGIKFGKSAKRPEYFWSKIAKYNS